MESGVDTDRSVLAREIAPFCLAFAALTAGALLADAMLHWLDLVWVGRYLGIPGVLAIVGSFGFSLRKRGIIAAGDPGVLLRVHERMAWFGSLLILVHAGVHFNALLGWLAIVAMSINVGSGLTGKYLLRRARGRLDARDRHARDLGLSGPELERHLHWDNVAFGMVRKWRAVHYPIAFAFGVLAVAHISSIFVFWGWR